MGHYDRKFYNLISLVEIRKTQGALPNCCKNVYRICVAVGQHWALASEQESGLSRCRQQIRKRWSNPELAGVSHQRDRFQCCAKNKKNAHKS